MSERITPHYRLSRALSLDDRANFGLELLRLMRSPSAEYFKPRRPRDFHTSVLSANELEHHILKAPENALIHRLPPSTWALALNNGVEQFPGHDQAITARIGSLSIFGNNRLVARLYHPQLRDDRQHLDEMTYRLTGSHLTRYTSYVMLGTLAAGFDPSIIEDARSLITLRSASLEPLRVQPANIRYWAGTETLS